MTDDSSHIYIKVTLSSEYVDNNVFDKGIDGNLDATQLDYCTLKKNLLTHS